MNIEQITAEAGFAQFAVAASYNAGTGAISCQAIIDQSVDELSNERIPTRRTEISLLISEIGAYKVGATIVVNSTTYTVRELVADDGFVRRVAVGRQ